MGSERRTVNWDVVSPSLPSAHVLYAAPWKDPIPLQRAWMLWEALSTLEAPNATLSIEVPPAEAASFETALTSDFDSIEKAIAEVDSRNAECFTPDDTRMIYEAIERSVGHGHLNQRVTDNLRDWLATEAKALVEGMPAGDEGRPLLLNNIGRMLQNQGKYDEAKPLYREALKVRRETLGDRHTGTLFSINNLGLLLRKQGKYDEAEPLLREALKANRETFRRPPRGYLRLDQQPRLAAADAGQA